VHIVIGNIVHLFQDYSINRRLNTKVNPNIMLIFNNDLEKEVLSD
jgi:hypothetical protein